MNDSKSQNKSRARTYQGHLTKSYGKFSIETGDHDVYGTGYCPAKKANSHIGNKALSQIIIM
jgi:hypothetical protein